MKDFMNLMIFVISICVCFYLNDLFSIVLMGRDRGEVIIRECGKRKVGVIYLMSLVVGFHYS